MIVTRKGSRAHVALQHRVPVLSQNRPHRVARRRLASRRRSRRSPSGSRGGAIPAAHLPHRRHPPPVRVRPLHRRRSSESVNSTFNLQSNQLLLVLGALECVNINLMGLLLRLRPVFLIKYSDFNFYSILFSIFSLSSGFIISAFPISCIVALIICFGQ